MIIICDNQNIFDIEKSVIICDNLWTKKLSGKNSVDNIKHQWR